MTSRPVRATAAGSVSCTPAATAPSGSATPSPARERTARYEARGCQTSSRVCLRLAGLFAWSTREAAGSTSTTSPICSTPPRSDLANLTRDCRRALREADDRRDDIRDACRAPPRDRAPARGRQVRWLEHGTGRDAVHRDPPRPQLDG